MAKKVKAIIKLYCPAGTANPAPPVGPALGQHGINIMQFCKSFNEKTKGQDGLILPVVITAYEDRTFTFIIKSPPSSVLLKRACGIAKASGMPNKDKVGQVTKAQIKEIVNTKIKDLNANSVDAAIRIVEGTARSMGIDVVDDKELKNVTKVETERSKQGDATVKVGKKDAHGESDIKKGKSDG